MKKTVNPENVAKIAFSQDEILQVNLGNSQEVQEAIEKVAVHPKGEKLGVKLNEAFENLLKMPAFKNAFEPHIEEVYAHNGATC